MKFNFYIRFFLTVLVISSFNVGAMAQMVSFSPSRLFFKGNPGETITETITINNSGTKTFEFIASLKDWKRDTLGEKTYASPGTLPNSNAATISLPVSNMKIGPGEKKTYTISMLIPKEQTKDAIASNSMLFFTQTNAQTPVQHDTSGMGIRISFEFGIQLFYTPNGAKTGELGFLAFEQQHKVIQKQKTDRLAVKFENTGEINKDGQLRFELTNKETGEEIKLKPVSIAIMPKDFQWAYFPLPNDLPKGSYLAVAILDVGENANLKVAEKEINIKK